MNDLHISASKSTISRVIKADPNIVNKKKKRKPRLTKTIKKRDWTGQESTCTGKLNGPKPSLVTKKYSI